MARIQVSPRLKGADRRLVGEDFYPAQEGVAKSSDSGLMKRLRDSQNTPPVVLQDIPRFEATGTVGAAASGTASSSAYTEETISILR